MPILSVIMREVERMGLRRGDSNPRRGIRRHRRRGRERSLSDDEIRGLSAAHPRRAGAQPSEVAAVRLLLLTGCGESKILTLRWSDYRESRLFLRDSKSGLEPSGCRSPPQPFPEHSTGSVQRCFRRRSAADRNPGAGWTASGAGSAPRLDSETSASTTSATVVQSTGNIQRPSAFHTAITH